MPRLQFISKGELSFEFNIGKKKTFAFLET